jgi:multisubunit Na+/H+ antiporter MnhC subunit
LYVYALLFLLIFIVGTYLNLNPAVYVLIMGTLIEAVGIWLMVRFLRKYPLPEQEGAHE